MTIDIHGYSAIGTGLENQDHWISGPLGTQGFYAMVADGLGGHTGGRQASHIALQTMLTILTEDAVDALPSQEQISQWLLTANENILRQQGSDHQMKTTIVCLFVYHDRAIWAHIGDSRLYYFFNGDLIDYTKDHSVCQLAVRMGEITRSQIPGHKDKNKLLRVMGEKKCSPEIHEPISLGAGMHSFFLCSDGLWERVLEEEIMLDLHKSDTAEQWIRYLRKRAEKRQYQRVDNNTAIAAVVDHRMNSNT